MADLFNIFGEWFAPYWPDMVKAYQEGKAQMSTQKCIRCEYGFDPGTAGGFDGKGRPWCSPCIKTTLNQWIKPKCSKRGPIEIDGIVPLCELDVNHTGQCQAMAKYQNDDTITILVKWPS